MFLKTNENKTTEYQSQKEMNELKLKNEELEYELKRLELKLKDKDSDISDLEYKLREYKSGSLEKENAELKREIEKLNKDKLTLQTDLNELKFKIENDVSNIEMKTENVKLSNHISVQEAENKHLKELLDVYRSMPDVKNMIDNLQGLAIPSLDKLKEFTSMISDSKIDALCKQLKDCTNELKEIHNYNRLDSRRFY